MESRRYTCSNEKKYNRRIKINKSLYNIVSEAIIIALSLSWLVVMINYVNMMAVDTNVDYVGLELFMCTNKSSYIRVIKAGIIDELSNYSSIYYYNVTTGKFNVITPPYFAKLNDILLINNTRDHTVSWLKSGELFYFIDNSRCRIMLIEPS